jgi:hypothetical protein
MEYSFEIVDNTHLDPQADHTVVAIEYDAPLTEKGRQAMEGRIEAWCVAVESCMFARDSDMTPDLAGRVLGYSEIVQPGHESYQPHTILCWLEDPWLKGREYDGLFKMLESYNMLSARGDVTDVTGLYERKIVRVTID